MLCVLLSLQLVVQQSWHMHRAPRAVVSQGAVADAGVENGLDTTCPACAAMHLAPLEANGLARAAFRLVPADACHCNPACPDRRLAFGLYCRPPPRF